MLGIDWLNKGTIYWKRRSENTFNVIPGSSILLGLLDPYLAVYSYGFDRELMNSFVDRLAETFGYDKKSLIQPEVRFEHPYKGEDEATFLASSHTTPNKKYKVTIRNVAKIEDDLETKLKSLRSLKHSCECDRAFETDITCSMPFEACSLWGVSQREYTRSFTEKDKIYGEKVCKHEARPLSLLGYPLFDKIKFHTLVLPRLMKHLGELEKWTQENIDIVVKNNSNEMGWFEVLDYMKHFHALEESLKIAQSRLR